MLTSGGIARINCSLPEDYEMVAMPMQVADEVGKLSGGESMFLVERR